MKAHDALAMPSIEISGIPDAVHFGIDWVMSSTAFSSQSEIHAHIQKAFPQDHPSLIPEEDQDFPVGRLRAVLQHFPDTDAARLGGGSGNAASCRHAPALLREFISKSELGVLPAIGVLHIRELVAVEGFHAGDILLASLSHTRVALGGRSGCLFFRLGLTGASAHERMKHVSLTSEAMRGASQCAWKTDGWAIFGGIAMTGRTGPSDMWGSIRSEHAIEE